MHATEAFDLREDNRWQKHLRVRTSFKMTNFLNMVTKIVLIIKKSDNSNTMEKMGKVLKKPCL